jgi:hypothetical protein
MQLREDIRYALRQFAHAPGFTATAILTLALGIGATTAIFSLVHAVLLKSLPVAEPSELLRMITGRFSPMTNTRHFATELLGFSNWQLSSRVAIWLVSAAAEAIRQPSLNEANMYPETTFRCLASVHTRAGS